MPAFPSLPDDVLALARAALDPAILGHLLWFATLVAFLSFVKVFVLRLLDKRVDDAIARRQWKVRARNAWLVALLVVFLMAFGPELKTMALSLTAIAVAVVIAFKEMILCFVGFVLRDAFAYFEVGDIIEIDGVRGEVIDVDWVRFKIAEHDAQTGLATGRVVSLPNNVLFSGGLTRDPLGRQFVRETIVFAFKRDDAAWRSVWKRLPGIVAGETERTQALLSRYTRRVRRKHDAEPIDPRLLSPQYELKAKACDAVELTVSYLVTREERDRIRNAINVAALTADEADAPA